jgi:hypothetical protein
MEFARHQKVVLELLDARITRAWVNNQEQVRQSLLELRGALLDEWSRLDKQLK